MRRHRVSGGFNGGYGRDGLSANRERRKSKYPLSFALRRSVRVDDEVIDLMSDMKKELGCRYYVLRPERLVATLISRGDVFRMLLRANNSNSNERYISQAEYSRVVDTTTALLKRPSVDTFRLGEVRSVDVTNRAVRLGFVDKGASGAECDVYDNKQRLTLSGAQLLTSRFVALELDEYSDLDHLALEVSEPYVQFARKKNNKKPSVSEISDVSEIVNGLLCQNQINQLELGSHRLDLYRGRAHFGVVNIDSQ